MKADSAVSGHLSVTGTRDETRRKGETYCESVSMLLQNNRLLQDLLPHGYHRRAGLAHTRCSRDWLVSRQHSADNEHHSGHPETTGDQRLLAAKSVDTDVEEDCGGDDFDGAVDSGGEHGRVRFAKADGLEDLRGVAGGKGQSKSEDVNRFGAELTIQWSWCRKTAART
jgi:hypothetical protein